MENGLFNVFVFLAAACLVVPLASRFKLGSVLGYLAAGIVIGPFGLGLTGDAEEIMHFAEFGVVMMLFLIGLELEPALLWHLRKSIVGLGGLQVVLTSLAFTLIGVALGYSWQMSLATGMALSLSSTALVLQMLQETSLMNTPMGETSFSVLLFQDIAVIPILIIIPLLATQVGQGPEIHASLIAALPGWAQALIVTCVIAAVIVAGRYLSYYLFRAVARTKLREVFTALSLAVVVGITLLMQLVGVSPAMGAFIAGVVLANSEYRHTLQTDIEPFKGLLLGLFFISVGMGMDFHLFAESPLPLLLMVAALITVKGLILFTLGKFFGLDMRHSSGFAFALAQGGEFAFVLFQFAGTLHILPQTQEKCLTLVVATSIAVTPLLMALYNQLIVPKFLSVLPEHTFDRIEEENPIILAGFGRFGQVIGRFLNVQGVKTTVLEKNPDQVELLRKFGFKGYFGDASRLDLLRSAGAHQARLLIVAVDDPETCLEIVRLAKAEFPHLQIFARAHNRRHAYELTKAGVDYYQREIFNSSLEMAQKILVSLGKSESDTQAKAIKFKAHDEATLKASFEFFDDEPALVSFTRTQRAELERILQNDISGDGDS
ncbi:monovalent cation:proton antiporter-2 (CPA2) family protein [Methylomonas paludis]|uniref:Monovalent cation:proton antiporter-2 (CPA2) family protein n=1 Tax=Methylomonas paludis TaxID=1173101 RepID=A0A975R942_9GAMM|nr:monovalent cation:proton antiporter-2 (CPA2) family protein [Methylomonas paludis]QWF69888.1 monovalent cation:proton antiporter-2 (CPA2) family protein [Methylomonas paludis]